MPQDGQVLYMHAQHARAACHDSVPSAAAAAHLDLLPVVDLLAAVVA